MISKIEAKWKIKKSMSKMLVKGCADIVNQTHERSVRISRDASAKLVDEATKIEYQDNGVFGTLILYGIEKGIIYTISFPKE